MENCLVFLNFLFFFFDGYSAKAFSMFPAGNLHMSFLLSLLPLCICDLGMEQLLGVRSNFTFGPG
jgi:hypothetical protein